MGIFEVLLMKGVLQYRKCSNNGGMFEGALIPGEHNRIFQSMLRKPLIMGGGSFDRDYFEI